MPSEDPGRDRWRATTRAKGTADQAERRDPFVTTSDLEIADLYTPADVAGV